MPIYKVDPMAIHEISHCPVCQQLLHDLAKIDQMEEDAKAGQPEVIIHTKRNSLAHEFRPR